MKEKSELVQLLEVLAKEGTEHREAIQTLKQLAVANNENIDKLIKIVDRLVDESLSKSKETS